MKTLEFIIRLFFPLRCLGCDDLIPIDSELPYCPKCHSLIRGAQIHSNTSMQIDYCDRVYSLFMYSDECVKHTVFHMKKYFSAPFFDFLVSECQTLKKETQVFEGVDLITYVTRKNSVKLKEGVDQAQQMAKAVSKASGIPYKKTIKRKRNAQTQHELTREERFENVKKLFYCDLNLDGKNVLLVDDVCTTGATVSACAKALKKAGAKSVVVLTFSC